MSEECLARFQKNQQDFFAPICYHIWNMGPLLYPRDKTTVQRVEICWFSTTKESKGNTVGQKGHGISFLGCERDFLNRLSSNWSKNYGTILSHLLGPATAKDMRKKASFSKEGSLVPSGQCMPTHICRCHGKKYELRYKLLPHLPYSPDMAPSDFHLFPELKIFLGGWRFSSNKELIGGVEYFASLEDSNFWDGIKALEHRWTKCIAVQGDYIEK